MLDLKMKAVRGILELAQEFIDNHRPDAPELRGVK
jgi:hypothetical protein